MVIDIWKEVPSIPYACLEWVLSDRQVDDLGAQGCSCLPTSDSSSEWKKHQMIHTTEEKTKESINMRLKASRYSGFPLPARLS